jgi:hypothetical protein
VPQSPALVIGQISDGHRRRHLSDHLDRAAVPGGSIAGLAAPVLGDHVTSMAITARDQPGADTGYSAIPGVRAGRRAHLPLPGGRAQSSGADARA